MVVNNSKVADGRHFENRYIAIISVKHHRIFMKFCTHRLPCSDLMDMLRRLIGCRIIIIIIFPSDIAMSFGTEKLEWHDYPMVKKI